MREDKYLSEATQYRAKYEPIIATVAAELQHDRDVLAAACATASAGRR